MKSAFLLALRATLVAGAAFGSAAIAQSVKFETMQAGTYQADPAHTQVVFSVLHLGFTNFYGIFSAAAGTLQLNPTQLADSKLNISIPTDSLTTTVPVLTRELKGDQWFDAGKFPTATFVSRKIVRTGSASAQVTGDLTLHGVTKSEVFTMHLVGAGTNPLSKLYTVGFEASGEITRSDFGIKTDVPLVGDEVTLRIAGAFEARP
jgi:polyisoprenoid-binding protein YceI